MFLGRAAEEPAAGDSGPQARRRIDVERVEIFQLQALFGSVSS